MLRLCLVSSCTPLWQHDGEARDGCDFAVGSVCTFSCNLGLEPLGGGQNVAKCELNGSLPTWNTTISPCMRKDPSCVIILLLTLGTVAVTSNFALDREYVEGYGPSIKKGVLNLDSLRVHLLSLFCESYTKKPVCVHNTEYSQGERF